MSEELVEAVARAMCRDRHPCWSIVGEIFERDHDGQATEFRGYARAAIALIRPATLEEAAKVAEAMSDDWDAEWRENLKRDSHLEGMSDGAHDVAAAIRALATDPGPGASNGS